MLKQKIQQQTSCLDAWDCTRSRCFQRCNMSPKWHPAISIMQQSSGEMGKFLKFVVILCCQDVRCVRGDFLKGHGSITHALTHHYCKGLNLCRKDPPWMTTKAHLSLNCFQGNESVTGGQFCILCLLCTLAGNIPPRTAHPAPNGANTHLHPQQVGDLQACWLMGGSNRGGGCSNYPTSGFPPRTGHFYQKSCK